MSGGSSDSNDLAALNLEGAWVELRARVAPGDSDLVADVLASIAPGGVVEEPSIRPHDDADFAYDILDEPVMLRAFFPAPMSNAARRGVRRRLAALPLGSRLPRLRWSALVPVDWVEQWRRFYQPIEVGERLLICPSWLDAPAGDRVVVELDPGEAFGTGQHATTRLCLAALERLPLEGARVLDLGCGSGLLAIAAAKLGAREVLACDIDERAIAVARRNVAANDVESRVNLEAGTIEVAETWVAERGAPFDLIVVNISPTVTRDSASPVALLLAAGGRAILSGFIERDRAMVVAAADEAGLTLLDVMREDGWCALLVARG